MLQPSRATIVGAVLFGSLLPCGEVGADDVARKALFAAGFHDGDAAARRATLIRAADVGKDAEVYTPEMIRLLRDPEPTVRLDAAYALGETKTARPEAVSALAAVAEDDTPAVRRQAIEALASLGEAAWPATASLLKCLRDGDEELRKWAARAIGAIGVRARLTPRVVELLVAVAEMDGSMEVRVEAVSAVAKVDTYQYLEAEPSLLPDDTKDAVLPRLSGLLDSPNRRLRIAAARAIGDMGTTHQMPEIVGRLVPLASDADEGMRYAAIMGLRNYGFVEDPRVATTLVAALRDLDYEVRKAVVEGLGTLANGLPSVAKASVAKDLTAALDDKVAEVRRAAIEALAHVGKDADPEVVGLVAARLRDDPSDDVRGSAAAALRTLPIDADGLGVLARAAGDSFPEVRRSVVGTMVNVLQASTSDEEAAGEEDARDDEISETRVFPSEVRSRASDAVISRITDTDMEVRRTALGYLLAVGPIEGEVVPQLVESLRHPDTEVRRQAVDALALFGPRARLATSALTDRMLRDRKPNVRRSAAVALRYFGREVAEEAAQALTSALDDESRGVRIEVAKSLARMGAEAKPALQKLVEGLAGDRGGDEDPFSLEGMSDEFTADLKALHAIGPDAVRALKVAYDQGTEERPAGTEFSLADLSRATKPIYKRALEQLSELDKSTVGRPVRMIPLRGGAAVELTAAPDHPLFLVATWCDYSRAFARMLKRPSLALHLQRVTPSFIFEPNEWAHVRAVLERRKERDVDAAIEVFKRRSGDERMFDPVVVAEFPGPAYVPDVTDVMPDKPTFPSALALSSGRFDQHVLTWMEENLNIPSELLNREARSVGLRKKASFFGF